MYTDFFHLNEEPFQVTPNPKYLFLSNVHREALQKLTDGVRRRKGFIEMVGIAGTGKTILCKELVQMLSPEIDIAYLFYPVLNEQVLYLSILRQWGVHIPEDAPVSLLLDRIYDFLKERFEEGCNALIILDEAQNLSIPLLENLRLLSNLETESEKLLQILLTGQPEFHNLLKSGKIPQLDQRIRVRVFLKPLERETLPLYIYHRLNTAGAVDSLEFTGEALDLVYRMSGGIPRMINDVCERALEEAYRLKTYRIDPSIVRGAQEGFEGKGMWPGEKSKKPLSMSGTFYRIGLGVLFLLFVGMVVWITMGRSPSTIKKEELAVAKTSPASPQKAPPPYGEQKAVKYSGPLRVLPSNVMEHFLEGMLDIREGQHLYWGDLRLGQRDLFGLRTPALLHIVGRDGSRGWICVRVAGGSNLHVWQQGGWKTRDTSVLLNWTGRCKLPCIMSPLPKGVRALRRGATGESVSNLQVWLYRLGLLREITGRFDMQTKMAVRRFQLREGLKPDGVAGAQTLSLLFQKGEVKKIEAWTLGRGKKHDE